MDPLTMTYLALMLASTGASYAAQRKTNKARRAVTDEATIRRKREQANQDAAAADTEKATLAMKANEQQRGAELAQQYQHQDAAPTVTDAGTRFSPTAAPIGSTRTIEAIKDQRAKGLAQSNQQGAAQGALQSFGDVMLNTGLRTGRNAQDIARNANFTQGWQQNVMPSLFAKANTAGKDWATTADLLKLAATVMGPYALAKGGPQAGMGTGTDAQSQILNAAHGPQPVFGNFDTSGLTGPAGMAERLAPGVGDKLPGIMRNMNELPAFNTMGIMADPAQAARSEALLNDPYWWARPDAYRSLFPDYMIMH